MVNKRWCNDSKLPSTLCCRDLDAITVDCRPFYSPREFVYTDGWFHSPPM